MPSINSLSSVQASSNWENIAQNPPIRQNKIIESKANSSADTDASLVLALGKLKNYIKRIGLALIGKETAEKQSSENLISGQITPQEADDPIIGQWPSSFSNSAFSPPSPKTNIPNSAKQALTQDFSTAMQEAQEQEAILKMVQENALDLK